MIQQYGVLPSNLAFAKLQSLPVYIWNPIRNLFETKEDKLDPVDPPTPAPPAPAPAGDLVGKQSTAAMNAEMNITL